MTASLNRTAQHAGHRLLLAVIGALTIGAVVLLPAASAVASATPSASTSGASSVTFSSAVVYANIDPGGQAVNFAFQYGLTERYGAQTPLSPAGSGTSTIRVSQAVTGLAPDSVYHYRVVAFGPGAATVGSDRTFTTAKIPLSLAIVAVPNPVVFGSPFFVEGNLSGTGGGEHEVALQVDPFPYLGGFKTFGNPEVTTATGGFSFPVVDLHENAQLLVTTVGKPVISSAVVLENVAVRVEFHASRTRRNGFFRLWGTVTPAEVGALVGFQLLKPHHKSINQGGAIVTAGTATSSRFGRVMRVRRRGLYRALAIINDGAHVSSYSAPVLIR